MGGCSVPGCRSRTERDNVRLYGIPVLRPKAPIASKAKYERRRALWLSRIGHLESLYKHTSRKVCSLHFISGKPSAPRDTENPDWVPSLRLGPESKAATGPVDNNGEQVRGRTQVEMTMFEKSNINKILQPEGIAKSSANGCGFKRHLKTFKTPDSPLSDSLLQKCMKRNHFQEDLRTMEIPQNFQECINDIPVSPSFTFVSPPDTFAGPLMHIPPPPDFQSSLDTIIKKEITNNSSVDVMGTQEEYITPDVEPVQSRPTSADLGHLNYFIKEECGTTFAAPLPVIPPFSSNVSSNSNVSSPQKYIRNYSRTKQTLCPEKWHSESVVTISSLLNEASQKKDNLDKDNIEMDNDTCNSSSKPCLTFPITESPVKDGKRGTQCKTCKHLTLKIKRLQNKRSELTTDNVMSAIKDRIPLALSVLVEDHLRNYNRKSKRYSKGTLQLSLYLKKNSPVTFTKLRRMFDLPSNCAMGSTAHNRNQSILSKCEDQMVSQLTDGQQRIFITELIEGV